MSRSENTMTIDGSLWIAFQAASPSTSSRTANEALRIRLNVVRTNFESSTISTRFSGMLLAFVIERPRPAGKGRARIIPLSGPGKPPEGLPIFVSFCALLLAQIDHHAPFHAAVNEIVEHRGQLFERNCAGHFLEQRRPHVGGKALPHL